MGLPKGYKFSAEALAAQAKGRIGIKQSESHRLAISKALKGRNIGFSQPHLSLAHKNRISRSLLEKAARGEAHYRWNPDKTDYQRIRNSAPYRHWRKAVLDRDHHACVLCGSIENLQADHIKSFIDYPELRLDINNGRTLCVSCHIQTENFGFKIYNARKRIHETN